MLRDAEEMRESADYKVFAIFSEDEIKQTIDNAKKFLKEAERIAPKLIRGEKFRK